MLEQSIEEYFLIIGEVISDIDNSSENEYFYINDLDDDYISEPYELLGEEIVDIRSFFSEDTTKSINEILV